MNEQILSESKSVDLVDLLIEVVGNPELKKEIINILLNRPSLNSKAYNLLFNNKKIIINDGRLKTSLLKIVKKFL